MRLISFGTFRLSENASATLRRSLMEKGTMLVHMPDPHVSHFVVGHRSVREVHVNIPRWVSHDDVDASVLMRSLRPPKLKLLFCFGRENELGTHRRGISVTKRG